MPAQAEPTSWSRDGPPLNGPGSGSMGRLTHVLLPEGASAIVTDAMPFRAQALAATSILPEPNAAPSAGVGIVSSIAGAPHAAGVVMEAGCDSGLSLPTRSTALTLYWNVEPVGSEASRKLVPETSVATGTKPLPLDSLRYRE